MSWKNPVAAGVAILALAAVGVGCGATRGHNHDTAPKAEASTSASPNPSENAPNTNPDKNSNTIDNYTMPAPAGYTGFELPAELSPVSLSKLSPTEIIAVFKKQTTVKTPADFPAAFTVALNAMNRAGCSSEEIPGDNVDAEAWATRTADKYLPSIEEGALGGVYTNGNLTSDKIFILERCASQDGLYKMNSTYNSNVPPYMYASFLKDGSTKVTDNPDGTATVEFVINERDNFGNAAAAKMTDVHAQNTNSYNMWSATLKKGADGWSTASSAVTPLQ